MTSDGLYKEIRLCSGKGSYEAIPIRKLKLDLEALKAEFESDGKEVLDARVMLIVSGNPEVTVMRDGRLLIKSRDESVALATVDTLKTMVEHCSK